MDMNEYTLGEGKLIYIPRWADDPDMLMSAARKMPFTPEDVFLYGKKNTIERQTVDFGVAYAYNKTAKPSVEWHPLALHIKQLLERQTGRPFVQCACNWYVSPTAYIGAHCDKNTPINGVSTPPNLIVSLSLGATRKMVLRPIRPGQEGRGANSLATMADAKREKDAIILDLEPGSLVLFDGVLNHMWKHAIPKDSTAVGDRISLTFREFK